VSQTEVKDRLRRLSIGNLYVFHIAM
jgi:hypothetical protein